MHTKIDSQGNAQALIAWIRDYASTRIDSHLADERRCFPPHLFLDLGNQKFFGMHVSQKYGGLGLKTYDMLAVIQQIAAIDLTLALVVIESIQGAHTLEKYASESYRTQYLPQLAAGRILIAGAMTESAAGSNPRAMQSMAIANNHDGWIIRGSKRWVGMGSWATLIAVYVQQLDSQNNWLGMSGFLIPNGTQGLRMGPESLTVGIRGFAKNTIYLDDVKVNSEQLLGSIGQGMEIAQDNMMYIRLCLAAANVGAMKRCAQLMYRYAERRTIATGKLLENPVTLVRISELTAAIEAIENFVQLVSSYQDENNCPLPEEAFVVAKILGSEYLGWAVDMLVQLLGARGYEESNIATQIFRDARTFRIFEGPTEALNMYIGSRMLAPNPNLQNFLCNILGQETLFNEIKSAIEKTYQYCQLKKQELFVKPFSLNYWFQALAGEITTYGLLLAGMEYRLQKHYSANFKRSRDWARNKFNEVIQKTLAFSPGESALITPSQLKSIVNDYAYNIGDIEQVRIMEDIFLDDLLKITPTVSDQFDSPTPLSTSITAAEMQIINKLNATNAIFDDNKCVHQLFEDIASQHPQAVAITFQNQQLTYQQLNIQANRLANYLRSKGVKENTLVAIYMERSIEMIIALLAILKAVDYIPLAHDYPKERLKFMLEDSGAEIILTHKKLATELGFKGKEVIFLDEMNQLLLSMPEENIFSNVSNIDAAYVIYTSGSTGKPKGIVLPHRALVNLLCWQREHLKGKRNVLQFTSLSFDMSFFEIFSAFCSGGTSVLISENDRLDLINFSKIIKKYSVEQLMLPVLFLKQLAESKIEKEYFLTLKEVITAGEQLIITPAIKSFFNKLPSCKLLNYYGPAETHVATAYQMPPDVSEWELSPPIGRPISNTKVLILDKNNKIAPIGVAGEILIGGVCLAKSYLNKEELTKERFIPDPWGKHPEERLYRTGDFAKYLPDGNIAYLGRIDDQVKIRGYRIELQEIEAHLVKCPSVKEGVVIAKSEKHGEKYLTAFIVPSNPAEKNIFSQIQRYLEQSLPSFMVPTAFNLIDNIPLTPSGKIDRRALEKLHSSTCAVNVHAIDELIAPKTKTEKAIIAIIEDLFNISVGINQNFAAIGGNSLLTMEIVNKIRQQLSVEVPAYSILSDPTIADIAKRVDRLISEKMNRTITELV